MSVVESVRSACDSYLHCFKDFVAKDANGHNTMDQALEKYRLVQGETTKIVSSMEQASLTIQKQQATIGKFLPQIATLKEADKLVLKNLQE